MLFDQVGSMAIGSRLRMLSDKVTEDSQRIYDSYGVALKAKWFPVFYTLSNGPAKSITIIAKEIGHSHPSVSKIVREMCADGLALEQKDPNDGRRNIIALTEKGRLISEKVRNQYLDVHQAVEAILEQTNHNLWKAMEEFEYLLAQKSLMQRVMEQKKIRTAKDIEIVPYEKKYRADFKRLNEEWISKYFTMEEADYVSLDHPKTYILDKGGYIFVALYEGEAVGVCAMYKADHSDYQYELAKMGVSPKAQGLGIGWKLGNTIIDKAKSLKAKRLFLESNTILSPAIRLYEKLGFKKVAGYPSPFERSNIQMMLELE